MDYVFCCRLTYSDLREYSSSGFRACGAQVDEVYWPKDLVVLVSVVFFFPSLSCFVILVFQRLSVVCAILVLA